MVGPEMQHTLEFNLMKKLLPRGLYDRICLVGGFPVDEAEVKKAIVEAGFGRRIFRLSGLSDEEVYKVLAISDLFVMPNLKMVLPSRDESFGNAMVEAMASGAPLITTNVGSIPEVTDEGRAAVLVHPSDPERLRDAIQRLCSHPEVAEELGRKGREYARARYSWTATAAAFERLFEGHLTCSR